MENNHYYTNHPEVAHDFKTFDFTLRGNEFHFTTDSNVFSKNTIDYGSRVLVEAFDEMEMPEGAILDVGCGYGPIGLSIAASTRRDTEMVDVNERAIELAKRNALENGVENVKIYLSNIYEKIEKKDFAAILTNPPIRAGKEVVQEILSGAHDHLQVGGSLWVVIQKKQGAPSAKKKMEEVFGNSEIVKKDKGYYILKSVKEG